MENYIKIGGKLEPGDDACFNTRYSGKNGRKIDIEITGKWDGKKFTSNVKYGDTVETVVSKIDWLTKIKYNG